MAAKRYNRKYEPWRAGKKVPSYKSSPYTLAGIEFNEDEGITPTAYETEYPSDAYEPRDRDDSMGGSTMETLTIIGAGVAAIAVIIYLMNKKAAETGQQVVETTIP